MTQPIDNIDLEIMMNENIDEFNIVNSLIYELSYKNDYSAKDFFYHQISELEKIIYNRNEKVPNFWRIQLQEGIEIYFFEISTDKNITIPREALPNEINFLFTIKGSNVIKLGKNPEINNKLINTYFFPYNFINQSQKSDKSSYLLINFNIDSFLSFLDGNVLHPEYFQKVKDTLNDSTNTIYISQNFISDFLKTFLEQIQRMPFEKRYRRESLKLKMIELIWISIFDYLNQTNQIKKQVRLSKKDYEKIQMAKELLIKNMINPPSLIELSKMVNLNEYKIKVGFKKVYGMPPYSMLQDVKLNFAKKLLLQGDKTVTEVAISVGYTNFSKFSSAFKKKFGLNPSKVIPN
ncbi:MAG: helix-turn-helix transcriptional regulator [Leptospiraceae bacterium]|nr:helix-turn-helix transcriptional regulator [Leptospiraceae bacterium]